MTQIPRVPGTPSQHMPLSHELTCPHGEGMGRLMERLITVHHRAPCVCQTAYNLSSPISSPHSQMLKWNLPLVLGRER